MINGFIRSSILVMDSLGYTSKAEEIKILVEYLSAEYNAKFETSQDF